MGQMRLMRWLQALWRSVRGPFSLLAPIRLVAIPLALLLFALIWSAQGQDAVRALIEVDQRCPEWGQRLLFCAMTTFAALQAWYWSRQLLRVDFDPAPHGAAAARGGAEGGTAELAGRYPRTETWTPRLLGAIVFVIALAALGRAAAGTWDGEWDFTVTVAAITAGMLLFLLAAFLAFVVLRRRRLGESSRITSRDGFGRMTILLLRASLLLGLLFLVWTAVSPLTVGAVFPAPSLLMISAGLWAGIGSFLVYWFDRYRVPLVSSFLALAVLFSAFNDNHAVRTLAVEDGGGDPAARLSFDDTFAAWYERLDARYPDEGEHPVFVVATEGGGIRAAYWTAAVLTAIQDQAPQFADHVFAISGVSGGSVGATVFTALVADRQRSHAVDPCRDHPDPRLARTLRFAAGQVLAYDFLAPTLGSMLHADLVQRFLPVGFLPDRARALETGWERAYRTHVRTRSGEPSDFLAGGFLRMYADGADRLLPSLFLNGTSVEEGKRMIATNCDLRPRAAAGGRVRMEDQPVPDAIDLLGLLGRDMRLSTAAHNSARFTYVSPAGAVRRAPDDDLVAHVVDGGYFENSGAQTADDVIDRLDRIRGDRRFAVHLILVKFQQVEAEDCRTLPADPVPPDRLLNESLSPVRALLDTRDARGTLAYAEVRQLPAVRAQYQFLLTQTDDGDVLPLGWLLAPRTRDAIDLQVGPAVPEVVDCALRPWVEANVRQLREIARVVSGATPAPTLDPVQREAQAAERAAGGAEGPPEGAPRP